MKTQKSSAVTALTHKGNFFFCKACDARVRELEGEGLTTSDAQGCAEVEHRKALEAPALAPSVVDVGTITEYGLTQKLSRAVRVF